MSVKKIGYNLTINLLFTTWFKFKKLLGKNQVVLRIYFFKTKTYV